MEIALFISTHRIVEAVEQVKNCLLEWTLNLESKGILGENMTFNEMETESAKGLLSRSIIMAPWYMAMLPARKSYPGAVTQLPFMVPKLK